MSWFPEAALDENEREGQEVSDGVLVERRQILYLSLGALAALGLGWPQRAMAEDAGKEKLDAEEGDLAWDALINKALPMAEKIVHAAKPNEDAYLAQLIALITRLKDVPPANFGGDRPLTSASMYRKFPFVVVQFKLQPGAAIPYHDHRDYIGVLSSVAGEARVRSFDIVGEDRRPPKGQTFQIRETGDRILFPAGFSQLSRTADNIHDVRAGKDGARLLDFFTFYAKNGTSVYLNVEEKARDAEKRVYEATWSDPPK